MKKSAPAKAAFPTLGHTGLISPERLQFFANQQPNEFTRHLAVATTAAYGAYESSAILEDQLRKGDCIGAAVQLGSIIEKLATVFVRLEKALINQRGLNSEGLPQPAEPPPITG